MEKEQVTLWVQNKIEKVLDEDIKLKIIEENSTFDIEAYVNYLQDEYFNDNEIEKLKKSLNTSSHYDLYFSESEYSSEEQNSLQNSLALESNEYQSFSVEEIIKNLRDNSEEVRIKFLRILELSAEDFICQNFLHKIVDILHENLNISKNKEVADLVLKVFQKLLKCPKNPLIICKGFTFTAEVLITQIDKYNLKVNNTFEKIYDIKEEKWICEQKSALFVNPEILLKLMRLLLDCQQQIRIKGIRFNETRYREIIFSFIYLLSSTTSNSESLKLSGLELISVLDPKANWSKYWCHTAIGRTLLCSALRKYKSFFIHIIEVMLKHMRTTKSNRLPSVAKSVTLIEKKTLIDCSGEKFSTKKEITSARSGSKEWDLKKELDKTKKRDLEWVIQWIPSKIVDEAVFLHSVSLMSCLIQFRSGRALFPVQTSTKKRLLNVQDLSFSIIDYLENFEFNTQNYTYTYHTKVLEILKDLRKLKTPINSSRVNTERHFLKCFKNNTKFLNTN